MNSHQFRRITTGFTTLVAIVTAMHFIASGRAGSLDTWIWRNPTPTAKALRGIVYSGSQFVAVGDGGAILRSTDVVKWLSHQSPAASDLSGIAYGNGLFVAVGNTGTIVTSTDG